MLGLRCAAKLCDIPANDGAITAFDTHGLNIYVGTEIGLLQKFVVRFDDEGSIYTTHIRTEYAAEKRKKVSRIVYSAATDELFVLSARRLLIFDAALNRRHEVTGNVGVFSVSVIPAPSVTGTTGTVDDDEHTCQNDESPTAAVWHRICACEKNAKEIHVWEYCNEATSKATMVQQLVLPEPALRIVEANGIMCVGLSREYSMVCVKDGDAKSLLALNGQAPAVALGDNEAFLRLHNMLFVVSIKAMPQGRGDIVRRTIPLNAEPNCFAVRHPYVFALSDGGCEVYSAYEDGVIESIPVTECLFVTQVPTGDHLFAAGRNRIWMLQMYPLEEILKDLIDRYKVTDAFDLLQNTKRFVISGAGGGAGGDSLAATAGTNTEGGNGGGLGEAVTAQRIQEIEIWLNIIAGFSELYHGNPPFALGYFNDHLDVREVLCHVPDLLPQWVLEEGHAWRNHRQGDAANRTHGRENLEGESPYGSLPKRAKIVDAEGNCYDSGTGKRIESLSNDSSLRHALQPTTTAAATSTAVDEGGVAEEMEYLDGWQPQSEHSRYYRDIEAAWTDTWMSYATPQFDTASSSSQDRFHLQSTDPSQITHRQTPEGDVKTKSEFIDGAWYQFKEGLVNYLQSRMDTSSQHQRRAIEYALLVLFLQAEDYASAWQVLENEKYLSLRDTLPILVCAEFWRALAFLLTRKGFSATAEALWKEKGPSSKMQSHHRAVEGVSSSSSPASAAAAAVTAPTTSGNGHLSNNSLPLTDVMASTAHMSIQPDETEHLATSTFVEKIFATQHPGGGQKNTGSTCPAIGSVAPPAATETTTTSSTTAVNDTTTGDNGEPQLAAEQNEKPQEADHGGDSPSAAAATAVDSTDPTKCTTGTGSATGGAVDGGAAAAVIMQGDATRIDSVVFPWTHVPVQVNAAHRLFWAIDVQSVEFVHQLLVEGGPSLWGLRDSEGNTPLHIAVITPPADTVPASYDLVRKVTIIARLVDAGFHPTLMKNHDDLSAVDIANTFISNHSERLGVLGVLAGAGEVALLCNGLAEAIGLDVGGWYTKLAPQPEKQQQLQQPQPPAPTGIPDSPAVPPQEGSGSFGSPLGSPFGDGSSSSGNPHLRIRYGVDTKEALNKTHPLCGSWTGYVEKYSSSAKGKGRTNNGSSP